VFKLTSSIVASLGKVLKAMPLILLNGYKSSRWQLDSNKDRKRHFVVSWTRQLGTYMSKLQL